MILTECRVCDAIVSAETLAQYSAVLDPKLGATERITFARCPDCSNPLLIGAELYGSDRGREVWSDPYRLYPQRDELVGRRIPRAVRKCFEEAISCFRARAYNASMMMCRRTLQSACLDVHIDQPTLPLALDELRAQGIIETRLLEWAEALPLVMNGLGATLDAEVSREDARDALEFTDAFLAYLYTFRKGFHEFRRRRDKIAEQTPIASEPTALAAAAAAASRPSNGDEPA